MAADDEIHRCRPVSRREPPNAGGSSGSSTGVGQSAAANNSRRSSTSAITAASRVQAELGHSDPAFTLRVYGHLWPDEIETGRQALDALLGERVGRHMDHAGSRASANPYG